MDVKQHFPTAKDWDQAIQSYKQSMSKSHKL